MDDSVGLVCGVKRSLSGRRWLAASVDDRSALHMAQRLELPEPVARILTARGIDVDQVPLFLEPRLRDSLPNPLHLRDMEVAAERIARAIMRGEQTAVFGDYDVDGATSAALLVRFFKAVGGRLNVYVPDRLKEGYGPNTEALLELGRQGAKLMITVDCGITAYEPLARATEAGMDVVVVDHHMGESQLPRAVAVVNPNRFDETSPHGHLAAVGVVFLVLVQVHRVLEQAGWYDQHTPPNLMAWLDLVALGTVCDVVKLSGVNRALVAQGLKVMARRGNAGLTALLDEASIDQPPTAYHLGFMVGPRVNAGGRVGASDLGWRILSCDDPHEATRLAQQLSQLNDERRQLEAEVLAQAIEQVESAANNQARSLVLAAGSGWHPGVIGIVASRLKSRYQLPACVVALDDQQIGVGSARSISGVDLGAAIVAACQAGLLVKGGGHPMAAGFTVKAERLPELEQFLAERFRRRMDEAGIVPTLYLDGALALTGATHELVEALAHLAPFGSGNAEPRFAIPDVQVAFAKPIGAQQNHLKCQFIDQISGTTLDAVAFDVVEKDMGQAILNSAGVTFHAAGRLQINHWQGRKNLQLLLDDIAISR